MKFNTILAVLALSIFTLSSFSGQAQKLKFDKGDFKELKGQKEVNVSFEYDMSVGKFDKEADYVAEKVAEKNEDERGTGDAWKEKWITDRKDKYEPKFFELFNIGLEKNKFEGYTNDNAKYTFVIRTTHLEPGWNVGVMRRSAHINVEIELIETGSGKKVGIASMEKVPGRDAFGYDFDTAYRVQEAYALTGKILAKYLAKKVLK